MNLTRDLGYGIRQIVRRPVFSLIIVFTLAIGIGPNVAIFSVLEALVLEPLPYPEPERLVQVWQTDTDGRWRQPFNYPDYLDIREQSETIETIGLQQPHTYNLGGSEPERIRGLRVTSGGLEVWKVPPVLGRLFTDEDVDQDRRVAILSDRLWKRRFDAKPDILGKTIRLDAEIFEVIGIMPLGFDHHTAWTAGQEIEIWTPLPAPGWGRRAHWALATGRLKPDVHWRTAEAEIKGIAARSQKEFPNTNGRTTVWIAPFLMQMVGGLGSQLLILLTAVGFVLVTACANVASMLLARGADRQSEVAIRGSLGAGRGRILTQLLTESGLLSLLGGGAGVLLAIWCVDLIKSIIPPEVPRASGIEVDALVLGFALLLTLATGLLFGLAPALAIARTDIASTLREGSGTVSTTKRRTRMLRALAVGQFAVAFLLANGSILLFTSYKNVLSIPFAFDTENVITTKIALAGERYDDDEKNTLFWERLNERLEGVPGIERAAVTSKLPLRGGNNSSVLIEGQAYDPNVRRRLVERSRVSSSYFEAMGIPVLLGRVFDDDEGSHEERQVVVNQAMVNRYWPDVNPIGQTFRQNVADPEWTATVIGVVASTPQWGPTYPPLCEVYIPYRLKPHSDAILVVRTETRPQALVPAIQQEVLRIDKDVPLADPRTMAQVLAERTGGLHFVMTLVSLFAAIAFILAMAGIFGTMAYKVAQRTREIGVRVAFGADQQQVLRMVMKEGLGLAGVGVSIGSGLLFFFAVILSSLLYGIGAVNVLYFGGSVLIMGAVALLATAIPAVRASRVDPVKALSYE